LIRYYQASLEFLSSRATEGDPAKLREVLLLCEAMGAHKSQVQDARAQLPEVASAYLAARLADAPPDILLLVEAISEAETEGLSSQAAEARAQLCAQLPQLVHIAFPFYKIHACSQ